MAGRAQPAQLPAPDGRSLALAGLSGCTRQPAEEIVPYINQPDAMVPGKFLTYATVMALGGAGQGLLVKSTMGRPIKVDGNPRHPTSAGGSDPFMQASILSLYDPDRSQAVLHFGKISAWEVWHTAMIEALVQPEPPSPRLQVNPAVELEQMLTTEARGLNGYGWVDRRAGVVRIPIERSIAILARRGLPPKRADANTTLDTQILLHR